MPLLLFMAYFAWEYGSSSDWAYPSIPYSAFYDAVDEGHVKHVQIRGRQLMGDLDERRTIEGKQVDKFSTTLPAQDDKDLFPLLRKKQVEIDIVNEEPNLLLQIFVNLLLPLLLIGGLFMWFSRRSAMGGAGPLAGLVKGRTKRFDRENQVPVKFEDVAGLGSAKRDLQEVVEFLKQPGHFARLGGKVPRGILLVGPPGTGKTLLARAVAGESGVPFFSINGSEFIELFVGVGASRVRELFAEAKKVAPTIIFIDEIDAVGRSRGAGLGGGHDEREQTLNQLLSEMDGFTRSDMVIVLAATNRPDVLDPALLRPGRFDRRVLIDRPEVAAREAILKVHTRDKPLAADVELESVAQNTVGFTGAELENLANEAALSATRRGASEIRGRDFAAAFDKIVLGDPRETKLDPEEKRRVAVHEAGHAVAAHFSPHADPLHRVSILPRGMALGVTQSTPGPDRHIMTRPELESRLRYMMGGYAAERIVLGDVSSGAENDLQRATDMAFKMVAHYGMSERLGPVFHEHKTEHPFLGQKVATDGGTSDATVHAIEEETRGILTRAVEQAEQLLATHRDRLDRLVDALLERETLEKVELLGLLGPSVNARGPSEADALHCQPGGTDLPDGSRQR